MFIVEKKKYDTGLMGVCLQWDGKIAKQIMYCLSSQYIKLDGLLIYHHYLRFRDSIVWNDSSRPVSQLKESVNDCTISYPQFTFWGIQCNVACISDVFENDRYWPEPDLCSIENLWCPWPLRSDPSSPYHDSSSLILLVLLVPIHPRGLDLMVKEDFYCLWYRKSVTGLQLIL